MCKFAKNCDRFKLASNASEPWECAGDAWGDGCELEDEQPNALELIWEELKAQPLREEFQWDFDVQPFGSFLYETTFRIGNGALRSYMIILNLEGEDANLVDDYPPPI